MLLGNCGTGFILLAEERTGSRVKQNQFCTQFLLLRNTLLGHRAKESLIFNGSELRRPDLDLEFTRFY